MNKFTFLQKGFVAAALLLGIQLLGIPVAHAGSLQAGTSNDALSLNLDQNIVGPLSVDAGYIYNYRHSDTLANLGAHLDFGLGPFGAMVGVKTYYASVSSDHGRGIAPGVGLSISPLPLFSLSGKYYYSNPDYSYGDIDHYRDWSVTANFHPIKFTNFFVGYGFQSVGTRHHGDATLYDGAFVGVSVGF